MMLEFTNAELSALIKAVDVHRQQLVDRVPKLEEDSRAKDLTLAEIATLEAVGTKAKREQTRLLA